MGSDPEDPDDEAAQLRVRLNRLSGELKGRAAPPAAAEPYKPEALAVRKKNQQDWLNLDPEIKCYLPGVPRATYMPYPFQILQSASAITFVYEYAGAVRNIYLKDPGPAPGRFLDGPVRRTLGGRHAGGRRHGHERSDLVRPRREFSQRQAACGRALHAHQSGRDFAMKRRSKIRTSSRARGKSACRSTGVRKRTRSFWISSAWSSSKSCCTARTGSSR